MPELPSPELPSIDVAALSDLIRVGAASWEEFRVFASDHYHLFIPCDHALAYQALRRLRGHAASFLEFGSATGVVTIMADLLGFEACGIEMEPWLVERSLELAERFGSQAQFGEGSYVPLDYRDQVENLSADFLTPTAGACGYEALGLELDEFDLVFAYPWPGDEDWLSELVRQHARRDAMLLTYDVTEGFRVSVGGAPARSLDLS